MTEITPEARQMAADLAGEGDNTLMETLARLCARFIAMQEDMVEIDRQLLKLRVRGGAWPEGKEVYAAAAIAAKYRAEADPIERLREWAKQHSDVTPLDGTDRNSPTFGDLRALLGKAKP